MHATVYEVEGLAEGRSYLAGLDHFDFHRVGTVSTDTLLSTPHISLYAFDDAERCAVFVETPPEVDLTAAPFYYLAQKEHARRLFTLSYETFNELARILPDPAQLVLLHSVGRCGSTLLCKALGELGVVTLSEPDVYTHVAGMRPPDGSRDPELTELVRSATRFHCYSTGTDDTVWLLKFRAMCIEVGDLMHKAFPDAHALFLTRDLEGWMRSMGRLVRLGDAEREANYQRNKGQPLMFIYPRDRYISLRRVDPIPPETRLEDIALLWTSLTKRYLDLHRQRIITHSLTFTDLTENSEQSLVAVADALHIPLTHLDRALEVFKHDSQAGTHLSGRKLREQRTHELAAADIQRAQAVASRFGLSPDITTQLPRGLLSR